MVLNKRIARIIKGNKAQYLNSILLVALSCLLFTLLCVMMANLQDNQNRFIDDYVLEDAKIVLQKPIDDPAQLGQQYDAVIEPRTEYDVQWKPNVTLRLFDESEQVNRPALVEGSELTSDRDILLSPSLAEANGIEIGSVITLEEQAYTVKGFVSIPDYIYALQSDTDLMLDPKAFGVAVVTKAQMQRMNKGTLYYNIKYHGDRAMGLKDHLAQTNGILYWKNIDENPRYIMADRKIKQTADLAVKLPVALLFLTCLLLATTMWRLVKMEFGQIGTLYALGYTKGEILRHYLRFPVLISLYGSSIGTGLGVLLLEPALDYFSLYFNIPLLQIDWSVKYLLASLLIPLVFLVPAVAFVVWRALRLKPVVLMRGGANTAKVGKWTRKFNLRNLSFPAKFKVRELMRNFPKSLLMLFGVTLASVFLLFGFVAQSSISYMIEDSFSDTFRYQYNTVFNQLQTDATYNGETYNAAPFALELDDAVKFTVFGVQPDARLLVLKDAEGNPLPLQQTIITRALADRLQLQAGDTLLTVNQLDDQPHEIRIDAVAELYTGNAIYMPKEQLNTLLGLPKDSFIGVYSTEPLRADAAKIMRMENREDAQRSFDAALEPMKYTLVLTGSFAFVIALIVLYVITSLIIEENKGNISMLKVLGYTPREINRLVLNVGTIPVLLGYLLAIPSVMLSLEQLMKSALQGVDMTVPITFNPLHLMFGFAIIYGTYELSKWLAKRKVLAVSMAESLKMQRD